MPFSIARASRIGTTHVTAGSRTLVDPTFSVTTNGKPYANASSVAKPKPSSMEGKQKTLAHRYKLSKRDFVTGPRISNSRILNSTRIFFRDTTSNF